MVSNANEVTQAGLVESLDGGLVPKRTKGVTGGVGLSQPDLRGRGRRPITGPSGGRGPVVSGGSRWATRILREKPDHACGRLPQLPALFQGIIQPDVSWEPGRFSPVGQSVGGLATPGR